MPIVTTKDGVEIFYKDWGKGQPIVFSHGWPLSADDWDAQMLFFLNHGYRVIAHDRRGHGRSTQTGGGHDMDHYADDLAALTAHLVMPQGHADDAFLKDATQQLHDRFEITHVTLQVVRHAFGPTCLEPSDFGVETPSSMQVVHDHGRDPKTGEEPRTGQ